jgi:hypothetical protein
VAITDLDRRRTAEETLQGPSKGWPRVSSRTFVFAVLIQNWESFLGKLSIPVTEDRLLEIYIQC